MNFPIKTNYSVLFFLFLALFLIPDNDDAIAQKSVIMLPEIQEIIISGDSVIFNTQAPDRFQSAWQDLLLGKLRIPHRFNSIYFRFGTEGLPDDASFQSYLEGFEEHWGRSSIYPVKEYSNLPPGKYTLNVRILRNGRPSSSGSYFEFSILPPFYKTTVAFILYVITGLLTVIAILRVRTYQFARERFRLERIINERTDELVSEKDKSEKLLANVLPKDTADEIMTKGKATKKKYQMATVLFSDIQGFTKLAEQMNPEHLIDELDSFFFHFDSVVEKYNIEKIKTIGDAYMCAGGIPRKNRTNPVEVVMAALEMQKYMKNLREQASIKGSEVWDIRIGIHTGPIIAGVVGYKKLSYDIWGDTVNIASRMESSGEAGKINISGPTYELVKDFFICEYRGKMPVKYKGEIDMYFIKGIRPDLVTLPAGLPNKKFSIQVQTLRLNDLEDHILGKYEQELPDSLYYHNLKHSIHVYTQVELIGRAENVTEADMLLLRTAGLLHDVGLLKGSYDTHEEAGCDIARELLPGYQYSEEQIDEICNLIMTTRHAVKPKNLLEKVMCDADSDYLGRVDFEEASLNLYKELKAHDRVATIEEWKTMQIAVLKEHDFYTNTARILRDVNQQEQIKKVNSFVEPV